MRTQKIVSPELDYLLGRGYRTAMENDKALEYQERALAVSPKYGPALYEKFVLRQYCRVKAARLPEPEINALRKLPDLEELDGRTLEGMIAQVFRDSGKAREILEKVLAEDPARAEAWESLAATYAGSMGEHFPPKEQEEAGKKADEVYSRALAQDRGYLPFWLRRGEIRGGLAHVQRETGRDPIQIFQAAEDDFAQAIKLSPSVEAWAGRARVRVDYGVRRSSLGENPLKEFDLADEDLAQAAHLNRKDPAVLAGRSHALRCRADYRVSRGESPLKELEMMETLATAYGAETKPLPPEGWMNIALLWADQGLFRAGLGEDPASDFERADDAFGKVEKAFPVTLHAKWARVRVQRGRLRAKLRGDPTQDLEKAKADLDHVFPAARFYNEAKITQAMYFRTKGEQRVTCGHDPTQDFEDARRCLSEVLEINPVSAEAAAERGHLELSWGRFRTKVVDRRGAQDHYAMAVRYFEEAIKIDESLSGPLRDWHREARRGMLGAY
jgi:tetratricopeptide (TPR) repeat protein